MANTKKNIEIHSDEVQEILGRVPSWIVRYGVVVFASVFVLLIVFSFIFRYPDVIRSKIVVTTEHPPATLVARSSGQILRLFVVDKDTVAKNQPLALIENSAEYEDVWALKEMVDNMEQLEDSFPLVREDFMQARLQLGDLQESYSLFLRAYKEYDSFYRNDFYHQKEEVLKNQLRNARLLYDRQWEQRMAVEKEFEIRKRNYERQKKLLRGQVVASTDLERAEAEMLEKKVELDGKRSALAQTQIDINVLEQAIIDNRQEAQEEEIRHRTALRQAFDNLKAELHDWMLSYLIVAPVDGVVTFHQFFAERQNVSEGDHVFTVVPFDTGKIIGKVWLQTLGAGKVKVGQTVNVRFDNYPYMEFGWVRGKVAGVSLVPENNYYMVEVEFSDGLVTNYGYPLQMQNRLSGKAEIMTEDLLLIQRFFNPLRALWKNRTGKISN